MEFLNSVKKAIEDASQHGHLSDNSDVLTGFSGEKLVGMLQRLSKAVLKEGVCYLEVGVYHGLTLLSVADSVREYKTYGIDNFAYFDKEGKNFDIVKDRIRKLNLSNANIINMDYEDALENLEKHLDGNKVGVYFIDGPHDYRSQLMCLALVKPFLAENAVIVIDDCNYRHVRQANRDFLVTHPEFKLMFESYTNQHPLNMGLEDRQEQLKGWWNGVNVIVSDVKNELNPQFPETYRSRALYENEHLFHATKHPEVIPFLMRIVNILSPIVYRFSKLKNNEAIIKGKFNSMNTYSENLSKDKFNSTFNNK